MNRSEFLDEAKRTVCQNRETQYGSPEDSFARIAALWSAYIDVDIYPQDVALMMALLKVARIQTGAFKTDSWVDAIGYLACGAEIDSTSLGRIHVGTPEEKELL